MTSHEMAATAANELRAVLQPHLTAETRRNTLTAWRTSIAQKLAEEATGVTFAQARLRSLYPTSELRPQEIERAHAYQQELAGAYRALDGDLVTFLAWCDRHAVAEPVAA